VLLLGWDRSDVRFVLPLDTAVKMFDRARKFGLAEGGRFQTKEGRTVVLWSVATPRSTHGDAARPIAAFSLVWGSPDGRHATVREVTWDSAESSEEEAWRAIDLLRGVAAT
jgi:hypothetical protein